MVNLHILVEGQTEEQFVKKVLAGYLCDFDVFPDARIVETKRTRRVFGGKATETVFRGGGTNYVKASSDLIRWMKERKEKNDYFTTMFDLYSLFFNFPGAEEAAKIADPRKRVEKLEASFKKDIKAKKDDPRFIPYIQLHVYEALLLSDPEKIGARFPGCAKEIKNLVALSNSFATPELINDGADTAPSKRIIKEIPEYEEAKASAGPIIAEKIGIQKMMEKCPHFREWVERLKGLRPIGAT